MSNSKPSVRVRFAPSPTGLLNLGGARSALFNWLFARHEGGSFFLRYEDTDRARYVPAAEQQILDSLNWLGLTPDEAPAKQSHRLELYQKYSSQLAKKGILYPCWCTPERLDELRHQAQLNKQAFKYDRHCLTHPGDPIQPHVLRLLVPDHPAKVEWDDAVKGPMSVDITTIDDFIAIKSDGYPTYHFANIIDDHLMEISHVLRADEWLASTPKHLLLYAAFDWQPPVFAHLPAVLGQDKSKKLSKRHGAKPVLDYRDEGYLPEAVINFMALLGWNPGDGSTKEIYTRPQLIKAFSLERIQKSPAVFDSERLDWMNGLYIRQMPTHELLQAAEPFWQPEAANTPPEYKQAVLELVKDRLKKLGELPRLSSFFFTYIAPKVQITAPETTWLSRSIEIIEQTPMEAAALEAKFRDLVTELGTTNKQLFGFLRTIVTGEEHTPPLFETMAVLGQDTTLDRLKQAQKSRT